MQLNNNKLLLREFTLEDWEDVHEYASMPEVSIYQTWGPNSPEQSKTFVKEIIASLEENPRKRFALAVVLKESGKVIGTGELNIRSEANKNGEISYIINPKYQGQGIGTEVALLLLDFGFTELNLHRIFGTCHPKNLASDKILKKIGMKYEGRIRENMLIRNGWRDSNLYSILENEWKSLR